MIKINALNKFYNKNRSNELHVLNDVSLELPERGMVAIFGRSGCGKTTLLNAIGGLDNTNSGNILIDGEKISDRNDVIRNKYIGYIFQNYNLNMEQTCFENVADALRLCGISDDKIIESRTLAALRNVGLENYKHRTPDTLSGGQMQRIAIARAIVKTPRIILADEPTGNLDEANTVMIMDLLKQIAQNHLVILVTHEADLVDHYCDRVIELADGKIVGERINLGANGYQARSKNDIYLGELEKSTLSNGKINVELYGVAENTGISLRIVNYQGKTYLSIDTQGVQVLDAASEIKLREGVYISEKEKNELSGDIDMSELPPLAVNKRSVYGRLFDFRSSLKSGFDSVMSKKKKKSNSLMRGCMLMFAFVIVFISSIQGTVFKQYKDAKSNYNQNVFYVYTKDFSVGDKLISALGSHGIDYTSIYQYYYRDTEISFSPGKFETYSQSGFSSGLYSNAVVFPYSMCKDMRAVAGSAEAPSENEVILTTAVADKLLERSTFGFVEKYSDIIGFVGRLTDGTAVVKGIVESDETAVYVCNSRAGTASMLRNIGLRLDKGSTYGISVEDGKTVLYILDGGERDYPEIGKTVMISGREYVVSDIVKRASSYRQYLEMNGRTDVIERFEYYRSSCYEKVKAENPSADGEELDNLVKELYESTYYEACAEFYAYADEYLSSSVLNGNYYYWVYQKYGHESAKYLALGDTQMACVEHYREKNGVYLTISEADEILFSDADYQNMVYNEIEYYYTDYKYDYTDNSSYSFYDYGYLLSDSDYQKTSSALGSTDSMIIDSYRVDMPFNITFYTLVHSNDCDATKAYLEAEFSDIETIYKEPALVTPEGQLDNILESQRESMIASLVTLFVFVAVLSLCVYFIMRSALMGRVKEIGIYRAIGVSKGNLIFRFLIETLVLTTLTVFVGYLISSFLITNWISSSSLIAQLFYFPTWLSVTVLVLLYAVCTVSGLLPILTLLRKTPSEILAKYDI